MDRQTSSSSEQLTYCKLIYGAVLLQIIAVILKDYESMLDTNWWGWPDSADNLESNPANQLVRVQSAKLDCICQLCGMKDEGLLTLECSWGMIFLLPMLQTTSWGQAGRPNPHFGLPYPPSLWKCHNACVDVTISFINAGSCLHQMVADDVSLCWKLLGCLLWCKSQRTLSVFSTISLEYCALKLRVYYIKYRFTNKYLKRICSAALVGSVHLAL